MSVSTGKINCGLLLDAAEEVVTRDGVTRFTLEAVARQAGLSKSGLLHHFHSKEALIEAVVERTVEQWRQSLQASVEEQPLGPHRTARALLQCSLGEMSQWNERMRRSSTALLAVLVHCSGKSTAISLLQRFRIPDKGRVLIDGHDIGHVSSASLRRAIAVVFQDAGLFNRSIAENIRVGRPGATDEFPASPHRWCDQPFDRTKCCAAFSGCR